MTIEVLAAVEVHTPVPVCTDVDVVVGGERVVEVVTGTEDLVKGISWLAFGPIFANPTVLFARLKVVYTF